MDHTRSSSYLLICCQNSFVYQERARISGDHFLPNPMSFVAINMFKLLNYYLVTIYLYCLLNKRGGVEWAVKNNFEFK